MRYIKIFFVTIFLLSLLPSCELLERTSPNDIDATTAITDAEGAENALIGLYSSMQAEEYYGGLFLLAPDALTDDMETGGFDDPSLDELGENGVTTQNLYVEGIWLAIYRTIANANYLLEGLATIDPNEFEEGRKEAIEGQARAIRAWAHFDLLRLYGEHWKPNSFFGVPIVSGVQTIEQVVDRSSVNDSYDFIINELDAAEKLVDEERIPAFVDQVTVQAMLAKVNLFLKDYDKADLYASQVIDSGHFSLYDVSQVGQVYEVKNGQESIFELVYDLQNQSSYNSLTYSRDDALNSELFVMSDVALNDFFAARPDDARATFHDFDPDHNDPAIQPNGRTQKYRGEETKDDPAYLLRFAEMFLIRAEARGLVGGLEDLNTLRAARGLGPLAPATDEEFMLALLDERRAELNFEGNRLFDLARTESFETVLEEEGYRAIFPIPLREIKATEGVLIQNPGY